MLKANLIARLFKKESSGSITPEFSLQIKNNGKSKARDIKILIDDEPAQNYVILAIVESAKKIFPVN